MLIRPRSFSRDLSTFPVGVLPVTKGGTGAKTPQAAAESLSIGLGVIDIAALTALTSRPPEVLVSTGKGRGIWVWTSGNQSANVTADPLEGLWAAPDAASSGASGAWKRSWDGQIFVEWFFNPGTSVVSDTAGVQAGIDGAILHKVPLLWGGRRYTLGALTVSAPTYWKGAGGGGYADGSDSGTILFRAAGTNAHFITIEFNSLFQNGSAGHYPFVQIENMAIVGNWGNNASGDGIHCEDGTNGWPSDEYGYSVKLSGVQIHEFNGHNLYLGINRNAGDIDTCVFRWSFSDVIAFGGSCGDHYINNCDIAGAQNGNFNLNAAGTFGVTCTNNHAYVSTGYAINIAANTSGFVWRDGQLNGNAFGAAYIEGNGLGTDLPIEFDGALCEANSTDGTGTYPDFRVVDRVNVKINCRHYAGGTTKASYLAQATGASMVQIGSNYTSDAFATAVTNDWTKVRPFAAFMKIFTDASFTYLGGSAFLASLEVLNNGGSINAWARVAASNVGVVQISAQSQNANATLSMYGKGTGGTQIEIGGGYLGFFGAGGVVKQTITGAKGGNAALTDLLAKLATMGLITDSTT